MNLKQKNGISLIILMITVIVMIILSGAIISSIYVSTENANLSVFVNDVAQLQESARAMYIMENELPIVDNATKISRQDILTLINTDNQLLFAKELSLNGESEDTYFYQIDLEKAGAGEVEKGTGVDGTDDIFVISASSLKVYYLKGVAYDGNMYFSINSNLANIVTLPETFEDESQISINVPEVQSNDAELENSNETVPTLEIGSIQEYDKFNVVNARATGNSVQVRYDYKNRNGIENNFDEEYMKSNAKIISIDEEGSFSLKVPKDVSILTIAAIDKAGNIVMQDVSL